VGESRSRECGRREDVVVRVFLSVEEGEVDVCRTHQLNTVAVDKLQEPGTIRFIDDIVVPEGLVPWGE